MIAWNRSFTVKKSPLFKFGHISYTLIIRRKINTIQTYINQSTKIFNLQFLDDINFYITYVLYIRITYTYLRIMFLCIAKLYENRSENITSFLFG